MASNAKSGKLVIFSVETDTPGTYEAVMSAKSNSFTVTHSEIDVSTKADGGWGAKLSGGGVTSLETTIEGIFLDTAYDKKLRQYGFTGEQFNGKITTSNGDTFTGTYIIGSLDVGGSYDGSETYSLKVSNVGEIIFVAAP